MRALGPFFALALFCPPFAPSLRAQILRFRDLHRMLPPDLNEAYAVALGDVDGDGDLDALLGNSTQPNPVFYGQNARFLNTGAGMFANTAAHLPTLLDATHALVLGDLDGDGDLDAVVGNDGTDRVLVNVNRQLAWRGLPRIGKPLTLDAWGPPSGTWSLAFSLATATLPLPPLGTLRLDPTTLHQVFSGPLDAEGRGSVTYPIPANPISSACRSTGRRSSAPPRDSRTSRSRRRPTSEVAE